MFKSIVNKNRQQKIMHQLNRYSIYYIFYKMLCFWSDPPYQKGIFMSALFFLYF